MKFSKFSSKVGKFFDNLRNLFIIILVYLGCSIFTFIVLQLNSPIPLEANKNISPILQTYLLATGGDPAQLMEALIRNGNIKTNIWIGIFHVLSWLLLPVVIAVLFDILQRRHDDLRRENERKLDTLLADEGFDEDTIISFKRKLESRIKNRN